MAGAFNDAPSRRMAYDTDGTVGHEVNTGGGVVAEATPTFLANANAENESGWDLVGNFTRWATLIFPELRELDGVFCAVDEAATFPTTVDSSADTTNGVDGTWTTRIADLGNFLVTYSNFRDNITSLAVATEKAIRAKFGASSNDQDVRGYHVYGAISPAETPDRILFLDTEDADAVFTKVLDFGDVPRGQTVTRTFKIKNNSSGLTINTIQITAEDLYLNAGDWYTFGDDGVAFQATFAAGNLGPGATKLIYLKQAVPDGETLGAQTGRVKVSHASLT
jgi:hypothetical protein